MKYIGIVTDLHDNDTIGYNISTDLPDMYRWKKEMDECNDVYKCMIYEIGHTLPPMNCEIGDKVESLTGVKRIHTTNMGIIPDKGEEGTVVDIKGYGIDIKMEFGEDIRVMNSDFPKYFKVI
jgi:hypothetical protein